MFKKVHSKLKNLYQTSYDFLRKNTKQAMNFRYETIKGYYYTLNHENNKKYLKKMTKLGGV